MSGTHVHSVVNKINFHLSDIAACCTSPKFDHQKHSKFWHMLYLVGIGLCALFRQRSSCSSGEFDLRKLIEATRSDCSIFSQQELLILRRSTRRVSCMDRFVGSDVCGERLQTLLSVLRMLVIVPAGLCLRMFVGNLKLRRTVGALAGDPIRFVRWCAR